MSVWASFTLRIVVNSQVMKSRNIGGCILRPIQEEDSAILAEIYASTRRDELALAPWSEEQKEVFLQQQFAYQHSHYQQHFPNASFDLLLKDGQTIGRLYVNRRDDAINIVDIALLPSYRGAGIGSSILQDLIAETIARREGRSLLIHVEKMNSAMSLYRRLGFNKIKDREVYDLMEWTPAEKCYTESKYSK